MRCEIIKILNGMKSGVDFENISDIISNGILTSMNIIALIGELNDTFGIEIGVDKLLPENFDSVDSIEKMIKEIKGE